MSGRHPDARRPQDTRAHGLVQHAISQGYVDSMREYPVDNLPSHAIANESRKAIRAGAGHLGVSAAVWVVDSLGQPCFKACAGADAPHGVRFRLHAKNKARAYILAETGGDPAKLRWNPFERASKRLLDDDGNPAT